MGARDMSGDGLADLIRRAAEAASALIRDLSLRVTLAFRREASEWRLVHRHADPLVHPINEQQLGALLRGES